MSYRHIVENHKIALAYLDGYEKRHINESFYDDNLLADGDDDIGYAFRVARKAYNETYAEVFRRTGDKELAQYEAHEAEEAALLKNIPEENCHIFGVYPPLKKRTSIRKKLEDAISDDKTSPYKQYNDETDSGNDGIEENVEDGIPEYDDIIIDTEEHETDIGDDGIEENVEDGIPEYDDIIIDTEEHETDIGDDGIEENVEDDDIEIKVVDDEDDDTLIDGIPEYAVVALINDDWSGLDDKDIIKIKRFMKDFDGYFTDVVSEDGFDPHPRFGKACNTVTMRFQKS